MGMIAVVKSFYAARKREILQNHIITYQVEEFCGQEQ